MRDGGAPRCLEGPTFRATPFFLLPSTKVSVFTANYQQTRANGPRGASQGNSHISLWPQQRETKDKGIVNKITYICGGGGLLTGLCGAEMRSESDTTSRTHSHSTASLCSLQIVSGFFAFTGHWIIPGKYSSVFLAKWFAFHGVPPKEK